MAVTINIQHTARYTDARTRIKEDTGGVNKKSVSAENNRNETIHFEDHHTQVNQSAGFQQ